MNGFGWLLAAVVVCLAPFAASAEPAAETPAAGTVTPEAVKSALAELEKLTDDTLKTSGVPGIAVVVVHRDEVVYLKGFGVRVVGKPERIDADTVFQLASVSKPITSTVLAALVGEGKIHWDDAVIDHDAGFCLFDAWTTRALTLRDLLCHRSGLPDHAGDLLEDIGYDRQQILHRLRYQKSGGRFRAAYAYTNFGYTEAAVAAALAVGKPWEEVAAEKLYRPLGMKSTSSHYDDFARAKNRALLHSKVGDKWVAKNTRQPDAQSPAGGVSSTLRDMSRWLRLQLAEGKFDGRQLVAAAALTETHTPQIVTGFDRAAGRLVSYGLGWNVNVERGGRVFWKHSGGFDLGMRTEVALLPGEQIAIAVFSNAGPSGIPEAITESFFDLVLDGTLQRDWVEFANRMFQEEINKEQGKQFDYSHPPADKSPPLPLSAYVGTYRNDYFGPIELAERDKSLELRLGPKKLPFALRHFSRDTFVYQPMGEMAGGPSGVLFSIGPSGKATQARIENLDVHGEGTFERERAAAPAGR